MIAWSKSEPRLTAAKMPAGMPRTMAKSDGAERQFERSPETACKNSSSTGRLVTIDVPKSPVQGTAEIVEILHATAAGRSRSCCMSSRVALGRHDALAGHAAATGSPGSRRMKAEGDDGDPDEGRDRAQQAAQKKAQHLSSGLLSTQERVGLRVKPRACHVGQAGPSCRSTRRYRRRRSDEIAERVHLDSRSPSCASA